MVLGAPDLGEEKREERSEEGEEVRDEFRLRKKGASAFPEAKIGVLCDARARGTCSRQSVHEPVTEANPVSIRLSRPLQSPGKRTRSAFRLANQIATAPPILWPYSQTSVFSSSGRDLR